MVYPASGVIGRPPRSMLKHDAAGLVSPASCDAIDDHLVSVA